MSEHNLWQNADTCNITLPNLWIKCLQCGNWLIQKAKAVQWQHVTSIWPLSGAVFNTTHYVGARARDKIDTLLQKFRLKINIAAYGGVAGVLVALGPLQQISISWKPTRFPTFLCIYCLCEVALALAMMSRVLAHTIHTHYKIRRWSKNP